MINNKHYPRSNLVWFIEKGVWPTYQIDHINDDSLDDYIDNLQDIPCVDNIRKQVKIRYNNTSGYPGVSWNKRLNKYHAQFRVRRHLLPNHLIGKGKSPHQMFSAGYFDCPKQAHEAYLEKKEEILNQL